MKLRTAERFFFIIDFYYNSHLNEYNIIFEDETEDYIAMADIDGVEVMWM